MASPQITPLLIRLGIEGYEGVDRLSGAFRNLSKTLGPSAVNIDRIRQSVLNYAETSGRTEVAINGTIEALRGLQAQAQRGSETWNALSGDIERFRNQARATDAEITTLRQSVLDYANGTNQSQQSIRSYIGDLERLRSQATLGSATFVQLGQDIATLTTRLQAAEAPLENVGQRFRQVLGQRAASTAAGVSRQIDQLNQEINAQQEIITTIDSGTAAERRRAAAVTARTEAEAGLNRALAQRAQLTYGEGIRTGRERVRTAAAAFNAPEFTGAGSDFSLEAIDRRFGALPNTTAALNQRLGELRERLDNTERSSTSYTQVAIEMANVQRQLNAQLMGTAEAFRRIDIAEEGAARRAEKLANVQQYYAGSSQVAPGVGGFRDPNTGAIIARGSYDPNRIRVDEAAYQRPIGPEPLSAASTRALKDLEDSGQAANQLYERSRIERAELQAKYNQLQLDADAAYDRQASRQRQQGYDKDVADFDRRLEAASRKRGRRLSGMQLAQTAGAAISGGIFGGVEGFAGGAIGGAIGGVGGAFAGAAIGAQVGMVRQQIGEMTSYAAEIRRMQIALQGVVGSFEDYRTAIQTTREVADRFNIPLQESTQRFTQLSAAVMGSGGTIQEARTTFNNVTAAIIATGGSTEQVNAALTATAQVFSKGKVTAEELRGQLGERLPGAFSLFAKSMGVSTKELDKLLEQGKVGLPEFVNFAKSLGTQFGETADRMAKSSEQAGARMNRAFDGLKVTVGDALGPAGAAFQDFFTELIKGADAAIKKLIELNILSPGPNYLVSQVVAGTKTGSELQREYGALQAEKQLSDYRERQYRQSGIFGNPSLMPIDERETAAVRTQRDARLRALEEALTKLGVMRAAIDSDKGAAASSEQQQADEAKAKERENQAKKLLDLIDQREESIAQARRDREERLGEIRKDAIKKAADLERGFADERRTIERDIRNLRIKASDESADAARELRALRGEDRDLIEAEQQIVDIFRKERDAKQTEADRLADEERTQARTIAEFQKGVAEAINKANEDAAKRIGEVQMRYARDVSKLTDEVSGRTANRTILAAKLASSYVAREQFNQQRVAAGNSPIPLPSGYENGRPKYPANVIVDSRPILAIDTDLKRIFDALGAISASAPQVPVRSGAAGGRSPISIPTIPGAAQTTNLRQQRAAEINAAASASTVDSLRNAFVDDRNAIVDLTESLDKESRDFTTRRRLEIEGYSTEAAGKLVDLQNTAIEALNKMVVSYNTAIRENPAIESVARSVFLEEESRLISEYNALVQITEELQRQNDLLAYRQDMRVGEGVTAGLREYVTSMGTLKDATQQLAATGIKGVESAIVDLSTTGTTAFREFANSIIQDTIRVITQQLIMRSVLSLFNLGSPAPTSASSMVGLTAGPAGYDFGGVNLFPRPFAQGGVSSGPTSGYPATLHGTEAVVPLSGSRSIPVDLRGSAGGQTIINVNVETGAVDAKGPDASAGQDLARDLAQVVDARLVYHRRPGGLLSPTR